MLFKKIIGLVIAVAICTSVCCISVSASGFTDANKTVGAVSDIKGTKKDSPWTREHRKTDGKTSGVTETLSEENTIISDTTTIINAYDTTDSGYDGKLVHNSFRFNSNAPFQIRIRNGSNNIQWMNFNSNGGIYANGSSGVNKGVEWTKETEHTVDIVADLENGVGYLYLDKKLAAYSTNLQTNSKWYGYIIYTLEKWETGDYLSYDNNYESGTTNYVLYNDTQDYTVKIEDVLIDSGTVSAPSGDSSILFENNAIRDYIKSEYSADITYENNNSATIEGNYYKEESGYAQLFMRMLGGFYPDGKIRPNGDLIYISYTQKINAGSRVEMRFRNGEDNHGSNRLSFVPSEGNGRIQVSSFSNKSRTLNKDWNDAIEVGIVVDTKGQKAYTFIDGAQLGGAFDYSSEDKDFRDLRLYMNGTADNETSSVTISNWSMKLYDGTKDYNDLCAQIAGMPVYFSENGNNLEVEGDLFGMSVTAKKTAGADDVSGAKIVVAVYDDDGRLSNIDMWDYTDGATNDEVIFDVTGTEDVVKTFCIGGQNFRPFALTNVFIFGDYSN